MQSTARDAYLTTQVLTATPQKLHLMLIDGALRSANQGRQAWEQGQEEAAGDALTHSLEIVGELLAGVSSGGHELSRRLAGVYLYLFHTLTAAQLERDEAKLADVIRVLEVERETWQQVCERFGSQQTQTDDSFATTRAPGSVAPSAITQTPPAPLRKPAMPMPDMSPNRSGGISFSA